MVTGEPWYRDGLQFSCTQCGRCCRGQPGQVWVSDAEVAALASRLGMDERAFRQQYTFVDGKRGSSLRDRGPREDYACVFYDREQGCTVYEHRPLQCRTWPFWRKVVQTRRDWYQHALDCPGMNRGALHEADLIARTAEQDGIV